MRADRFFEVDFGAQTVAIPSERRNRAFDGAFVINDHTIAALGRAGCFRAIPRRRVTDVGNGLIVMLTPEEGRRVEFFLVTKHVARRRPSLTLRHHPVLHA